MRKFSVGVRHYWAKNFDLKYGGEKQRIAIEVSIAVLMLVLTVYFALTPALGLFFVGFLIPTIMFTLGALISIYYAVVDYYGSKSKTNT